MDVPGGGRLYYPSKAPLLSFAAVPIYWILRWYGGGTRHAVPELPLVFFSRLFLTVLPTLVMLVFVRRFLRAYLEERTADALTATYALGSLAFSYSLLFMSHQATAVLVFFAFYAAWRTAQEQWRPAGWLAAGAFCGLAIGAEYTSGLAVLAVAVYGVLAAMSGGEGRERWKRAARAAGLAAIGALPFIVLLGLYHLACLGGFFQTGYKHLNDAAYQPWHLGGFLGIRTPDPRALVLSYFSPLRGLFTLSPFLLLALCGVWLHARATKTDRGGRALAVFELVLLAGYTYFTSSFSYGSWGWTTGPRHLTGLVPFLLLPAGLCIERLARGVWRGLSAGLCVASVLITGALTCVNYIPDNVSSALFGLAVPLFERGDLPPTIFAFMGAPNPYSGALVLIAIVAAAIWIGVLLIGTSERAQLLPRLGVALATVAAILIVLDVATVNGEDDRGATQFLSQVWLAPPGRVLKMWP
jgi:hypothetical protein